MTQASLQITPTGAAPLPIEKDCLLLGSDSASDLRLRGGGVAPRHARISRTGHRFLLTDLDSAAGTFVNGELVRERELRHGDRIRLGRQRNELLFLMGDEEAATNAGALRGMATVLESLRVLGSESILDDVLARVLDAALEVTGAERAFVLLPEGGGELSHIVGRTSEGVSLPKGCFETSRKVPEEVFRTGQAQFLSDLGMAPGEHLRTMALGIRAVLCVPLRVVKLKPRDDEVGEKSRIVGVLYLDGRKKRARLLSRPTLESLETLAAEAAVAIENAELYGRNVEASRVADDLRRAQEIQRALMPQPFTSTGPFQVAGISLSCRAIGGDFLDFFEFSAGRLGVAVGDVAGKGPPAAILAAHLQGLVSASVGDGSSPDEVLGRVNRDLMRHALEAQFATFFYAVLTAEGRLTWCNAGHPHPFLLRAGGGVERLGHGGLPLGILEETTYMVGETRLMDGDLFVIFSDGVTEATNAEKDWFGEDRFLTSVLEGRDPDPRTVLDRALNSLRTFTSGEPQADDITLVLLCRQPAPSLHHAPASNTGARTETETPSR